MAKYRSNLPQLGNRPFLTDSGLETTLVFLDGIELPCFASFTLLRDKKGLDRIREYYARHARIARDAGMGFILEGVTWRASADWGAKLGYSATALEAVNRESVEVMLSIREEFETEASPMVISGNLGPRGDGYDPGKIMSTNEAQAYHSAQIDVFATTEADMVAAFTMTNVNEAIGITRAARQAGMPIAISFTVETDGRLPTGQRLKDAIAAVDGETTMGPAYYMINCAHPTHFDSELAEGGAWLKRIRGLRANASRQSHAELDNATVLDSGDPEDLGRRYRDLRALMPQISVVGGCCGTDHRHVEAIARAYAEAA